ncbi:hypothetical protein Trydic_g8615 [Trypoxylus dichotomus]
MNTVEAALRRTRTFYAAIRRIILKNQYLVRDHHTTSRGQQSPTSNETVKKLQEAVADFNESDMGSSNSDISFESSHEGDFKPLSKVQRRNRAKMTNKCSKPELVPLGDTDRNTTATASTDDVVKGERNLKVVIRDIPKGANKAEISIQVKLDFKQNQGSSSPPTSTTQYSYTKTLQKEDLKEGEVTISFCSE